MQREAGKMAEMKAYKAQRSEIKDRQRDEVMARKGVKTSMIAVQSTLSAVMQKTFQDVAAARNV